MNKFGHRIADYRVNNKSSMNYESRNPFNTLWDMNVFWYQCNGYGHKSFHCRKNKPAPYNNFKDVHFNENVKCYNCQEFGHIARL